MVNLGQFDREGKGKYYNFYREFLTGGREIKLGIEYDFWSQGRVMPLSIKVA